MILTIDAEFAWSLFGGDDLKRTLDTLNADDGLVGVIRPWHSQFKITTHQQLGRNVLKFE